MSVIRTRSSKKYDPRTSFNRGVIAETGLLPEGTQLLQDTWSLKIKDTKRTVAESRLGMEVPILRVTGLFQRGDMINANGRIYRTPIIGEAVDAIQEDLRARSVWGEFDHPPDAKIHLDRISHLITKIWMEGSMVFGEAEIIEDLTYGKQLATLLRHGTIGISSRGVGDMEVREENGQQVYYVTEGYRFVTWDAVAEPSVKGATLQVTEGKLRPTQTVRRAKAAVTEGTQKSRQKLFSDHTKYIAENRLVQEIGKFLSR